MFGKLFKLIGGNPPREAPRAQSTPPTLPEPTPTGGEPAGTAKVFSSRAVRDAAVVTATIEAMRRFADGQEPGDDLAFRLEGLSADQTSFLQLSAEPTLLQRCLARAETARGPKAAPLRRLLADLAGPGPTLAMPYPAAPQPLPPIPAAPPRAEAPAPSKAPVLVPGRPPVAPSMARPAAPAPAPLTAPLTAPRPEPAAAPIVPPLASLADTGADPAAALAAAPPVPPVTAPPKPAEPAPGLPRLDRGAAEARRARLMDSLSDHLSANEAAP
ncbi:hypothetical protein HHL28_17615 [Aerophototrophica crusticola]|uniref:Uncharacterized protein n=1 Tax=Aerophototrophica crusticola TaxID=1709002 RepID=A0A858RCI6_9PROT|nr:hypothetical protein HHL28_17615 [Rhodospirillaceae bacterium B3]